MVLETHDINRIGCDDRNNSRMRRLLRRQLDQGQNLLETWESVRAESIAKEDPGEKKWTAKEWAGWEEKCRKNEKRAAAADAKAGTQGWSTSPSS